MGLIAKAIKDALEATGFSELCDCQRKTIKAYLLQRVVFVSAPTGLGAGKSLTFALAPYAFNHLFGKDCYAIMLVIVLLISLMKEQVSILNCHGIRALYIGDDCSEEQLENILNEKEKLVFGSPEAILNDYQHIFNLFPVPPSPDASINSRCAQPPWADPWALGGKFPRMGTLELSNPPGWGCKKRANAPSSLNTATFLIDCKVE